MHNNSGTFTEWFFQIHTVMAGLCSSSRTEFLSLSGSEQLPSAIQLTVSFRIKSLTSDWRPKFRDSVFFFFFLTWPAVFKKCFFLKKKKVPRFLPPQLTRSDREAGMLLVIRNLTPGIQTELIVSSLLTESMELWESHLLGEITVKIICACHHVPYQ